VSIISDTSPVYPRAIYSDSREIENDLLYATTKREVPAQTQLIEPER